MIIFFVCLEEQEKKYLGKRNHISESSARMSVKFCEKKSMMNNCLQIAAAFRKVRDEIRLAVEGWLEERKILK